MNAPSIRLLRGIAHRLHRSFRPIGEIPKSKIAKFLPRSPVVVEAGAHIGTDTVEMARLWPEGMIHAFEPVPDLYERLVRRTSEYPNVACYQVALSDTTGVGTMNVSSGGAEASSSFLAPREHLRDHPAIRFERRIDVPTMTLDDWAEATGNTEIEFLWLDAQGHELTILKSSPHVLKSVQAIYLEVCVKEVYEGVPLHDEVIEWLASRDFRVEADAIPAGWDAGNLLAVRGR